MPFMNKMRNFASAICLTVVLTMFGNVGHSQVSLPVSNLGSTSFEDGPAGPGYAVEQYTTYSFAGKMKNAGGDTLSGTNTLETTVALQHICHYSTHRVLGGLYGVEALVPFVNVGLTSAVAGEARVHGIGDLTVSPLMIMWNPKNFGGRMFFHRATVDIVVPTGKYSSSRMLNPGNNTVSVNPWYAFTYYPVKHSMKWEVSARIHYLWNSENDSPFAGYHMKSTQAGQAIHENYAASYEVAKGVRIGFNGYAVHQITDHKINGLSVSDSRERVFGAGPGVQFGGRGLWFFANSYFESGAQNRAQGTRVNFRVLKTFGGPKEAQGPPPAAYVGS